MKIRIFLIAVMCMMLLAIGMNTRNIAANSFSAVPISGVEVSDVEMIERVMRSVVKVVYPDFSNSPVTGFYVGNGIIVTAGHVAKTEEIEKVIFENGSEYEIIKKIVCPDYDCGFLVISKVNEPALRFDDEQIKRGNILFMLGHPVELNFVVTKGILSGWTTKEFFGNIELLVYDLKRANGNSGSPVVDEEGEVVAVHVGLGDKTGFYGVGICKDDILKALEQAGLGL